MVQYVGPPAHVVSGQRHPGTVWFRYPVWDTFPHPQKITGATLNALFGIKPVTNPQLFGRALRQHHYAAHTGA